jgi:hypothetical protein
MFTVFETAAIAGLVSLTALAAVPAKADDLRFGDRDARFGIYQGDSNRMHYPDRYRDDYRDDYRDEYRDEYRRGRCTPERALYKARQIGVHRARIDDVSRRTISVVGRSRGELVYITFARAPSCPIVG